MRILLWHGYLLTGSGSNVFTANVARAWRQAGHDVTILCQERDANHLVFVDESGEFAPDNEALQLTAHPSASRAPGTCRVVRPDLGGLLPVYVFDEYEGFQVKTFVDLSDEELEEYTRRNVRALVSSVLRFEPEVVMTGHEVMGPYIASQMKAETGLGFSSKLHGSALEYAVKKQERYLRFAREGLGAATRVIGGSNYMVEEASTYIPGWRHKSSVVNPGCDVSLFKPVATKAAGVVGFVGKLIASKGVHNFLAALPLMDHLERAVIVGYGSFEPRLRELADGVTCGDLDRMREVAERGEDGPLPDLVRFLAAPPPDYVERARSVKIDFTGRLDHGPLSRLLPTFDALTVPSVVPEAFGMVAAEAAAAGVLPVVPDHSGIGEAGSAVEEAIGHPGLLTFAPDDPILDQARALERVLAMPPEEKARAEAAANQLATERWSWERVAERLLDAATADA